MSIAFGAALLTFGIWFATIFTAFALLGILASRRIAALVPADQERFPRWLVRTACLVGALFAGATAGAQIGLAHAALAFGDSVVAQQAVVLVPFGRSDPAASDVTVRGHIREIGQAIASEMSELQGVGMLRYILGHLALGAFYEPLATSWSFGRIYLAEREKGNVGGAAAWRRARTELARVALRQTATGVMGALAYVGGLALLALSVLALCRNEIRRGVRTPDP
ncbi:MAG TPA: hypothetical protein VF178_05445 [Gemmatimonadaceae bacterium]